MRLVLSAHVRTGVWGTALFPKLTIITESYTDFS